MPVNPKSSEVFKKILSFNQITPSKDLSSIEYELFLNYSDVYELENDIISQKTYYKICNELNKPIPKPTLPQYKHLKP